MCNKTYLKTAVFMITNDAIGSFIILIKLISLFHSGGNNSILSVVPLTLSNLGTGAEKVFYHTCLRASSPGTSSLTSADYCVGCSLVFLLLIDVQPC